MQKREYDRLRQKILKVDASELFHAICKMLTNIQSRCYSVTEQRRSYFIGIRMPFDVIYRKAVCEQEEASYGQDMFSASETEKYEEL